MCHSNFVSVIILMTIISGIIQMFLENVDILMHNCIMFTGGFSSEQVLRMVFAISSIMVLIQNNTRLQTAGR